MVSFRNIMNVNSFNEQVWLLFLLATVGNVVDLIISYIGVVFLGLYEGNAFTTQLHLSNYLAIALAIITYQIVLTALYLLIRLNLKRGRAALGLGVIVIKYFLTVLVALL